MSLSLSRCCGHLGPPLPYPQGTRALAVARLKGAPGAFFAGRTDSLLLPHSGRRVIRTTAATTLYTYTHLPSRLSSFSSSSSRLPLILDNRSRNRPPMATTQTRGHAGHHHHHDNAYLVSSNKKDAGVRITRIGLWSNLGMAVGKGVGGYLFNSQSMIADAWHSLTDLASDILTLATVSWSLKPPTVNFPTGFGKIESLGSLGVSGMLFGGGLFMCYSSCVILYAHFLADPGAVAELLAHAHSHGHSHGGEVHDAHAALGPNINAAWLAAGTVVLKEWLYQATMKVARERKSSVLASNAIHHRVDSLTGIVTLCAILGANFLHNAAWLDPVGGLLISLLVIKAGFGNTVSALYELADKGIDEEVRASVRKAALQGLTELPGGAGAEVQLRDVQGVKSGQNYLVDLEIAVPNSWTVEQTRTVEEAVRVIVGSKVRGVRRLKMRFIPAESDDTTLFDEFIGRDVSPRESPEPEEHDHDHDHDHDHSHGDGKKTQ